MYSYFGTAAEPYQVISADMVSYSSVTSCHLPYRRGGVVSVLLACSMHRGVAGRLGMRVQN